MTQPNVVLIMADQLRADHLGFGGNTVVRTPNLDSIAERGARFDRAYVANPVCMPNRSSLLTSRVPSAHGTRYNGIALDPDANTFVRALRDEGYRTMLVGKAHFQNIGHQPEFAAKMTADQPPKPGEDRRREDGWDKWEDIERHRAGWVEMPADYYGFSHTELAIDHSDYCGGHYEHWLWEQGFDLGRRGLEHARDTATDWGQIYQPDMPAEVYPTAWVGARSAALITEAAQAGEPFFLQCSFPDPHHPFTPPGDYYSMYDPADIELPATFHDPHETSMPRMRALLRRRGEQVGGEMAPFSPSEEQYREAAAKEYGAISFIDDAVGKVLAALADNDLMENTIVIITSDHGDMFGDHGMMLKLGMHYEGCVRVPLVIAGPGIEASASESFASSLDVGPTVLDLAGVEGYRGMQGASLRGVLADPGATVRQAVYIEEDQMFDACRAGRPLQIRTAITDRGRISVFHGLADGELYDHVADPLELENRWHDADHTQFKVEMLTQLMQSQLDHTDTTLRPTAMA
ncbi:sulfatase family protein [Tomitella biformata]|uniref:sulfatase family protein n=1 Tax=Tomitella biformata TaxID=630403 RepID=UPI0004679573|nr:sulfatase-like hydrolase/transferase [Tomitella biformata]